MTSKTAQLALAALALAMSARLAAAEPPQPREKLYPLSRDEVNLVRVPGEMIEHAVYDTDALEVSPDKARGVLYVRVTPAYAASGKKRTAAFVSTQKSSYALAFAIEPVGAQEISVQPSQSDLARRSEEKAAEQNTNIASAAAAPMAPLASSDFVSELKTLLKAAAQPAARSGKTTVGEVFSESDSQSIRTVAFDERKRRVARLTVRQSEMRVSEARLVDVLQVQNMTAAPLALDWKHFARGAGAVLAVAADTKRLAPGAATRVYLIRDKAEAARSGPIRPALDEFMAGEK